MDSKMGKIAALIHRKLTETFTPLLLEVIDESAKHAGHAGARAFQAQGGGESHFHVKIISAAFAGQSKVARHRAVYAALAAEMKTQIHALSLEIHADNEA